MRNGILWILLVVGLTAGAATMWADELRIGKSTGSAVQLTVIGALNKDYLIESSPGLSPSDWSSLATVGTDGNGVFVQTDQPAEARRFYRASALAQITTTTTASSGNEDETQTISLGGIDPLHPDGSLQAVITGLAQGELRQFDGTLITGAPTIVTDGQNRVLYTPPPNASGDHRDSFAYILRRPSNAVTSQPQQVVINLTPVNDHPIVPSFPRLGVIEDTPLRFQLAGSDPDIGNEGDTLRFKILQPCVAGRLYQVNKDNVTPGAVIITQNVFVTNPSGYLIYVPPANANGVAYENFTYIGVDSHDAESPLANALIDIQAVNDAPVAAVKTHTGGNNDLGTSLTLSISDVDSDPLSIHFTELPAQGTLYYQSIAPENVVALGQSYSVNSFIFVSAHRYDSGSPYAQFSFYVQDPAGLTSATVTNPINLVYVNLPPSPTGPASYTLAQNTVLNFNLTASDPDGDRVTFFVTSLPQHGKLYFRSGSQYVDLSGFTLPIQLVTSQSQAVMRYVPAADYNDTMGPDGFRYQLRDQTEFNPSEYTISFDVTPAP